VALQQAKRGHDGGFSTFTYHVLVVVAMGLLFGLLGVLVATLLTAVAMVWIKMLYVHDVLKEPVDTG
jgi:predicted PurR-regulated permease PerM